MSLRLAVPNELAQELLAAELAFLPLEHRADPVGSLTVVTVLGLAGDAAAIVVALPTLADFARGLVRAVLRRRDRVAVQALEINVTAPNGASASVHVAELGEERAAELIAQALRAVARDGESA